VEKKKDIPLVKSSVTGVTVGISGKERRFFVPDARENCPTMQKDYAQDVIILLST
jgi:hypothetical protein